MPLMLVGMYFGGKEAAEVDNLGMMLSVVQGALSQVSQVYLFLGLVALMTFICCMNPAVDTAVSREGGRPYAQPNAAGFHTYTSSKRSFSWG